MKCKVCKAEAAISLRSHNTGFCASCFLEYFRRQVEKGIRSQKLFTRDEKILVALSGGKDSLALMLELAELAYNVTGLFIDLKIPGSSDIARKHVEGFCKLHGLPLEIVDLGEQGLAIPEVKKALHRPICSACGKIKRYFFNRMASEGGYDALATGHNLDDETGRLLSNTLRWDEDYLSAQGPLLPAGPGFARKVKPLWRLTEFETANYAFLRGIDYHCAVCPYSRGASFTVLKNLVHQLELAMPGRKLDFYQGFLERGKARFGREQQEMPGVCGQCGQPTWNGDICGICRIREAVGADGKPAGLPVD